ncbi:hypothetical protein ACMFMG_012002 [Clarireedia jacksonii]
MNNREVSKETEPDLVLVPASYWQLFLESNLEKVLLRKTRTKNRSIKSEDTKVVLTVTERSERDITKIFGDIDIDWLLIERQLILWGSLFRAGKKLRVNISVNYNYVETSQLSAKSSRNIDKRGSSTTQRMLIERAAQLDVEQESSDQLSTWQKVYSTMRCTGPLCNLGLYYWCDLVGKKHYKLKTYHLRSLISYVEQGHELQTQEDVPKEIRQQLYAEEQQYLQRCQKAAGSPSATALALDMPSIPTNCLDIPGLRDRAVKEYCAW